MREKESALDRLILKGNKEQKRNQPLLGKPVLLFIERRLPEGADLPVIKSSLRLLLLKF